MKNTIDNIRVIKTVFMQAVKRKQPIYCGADIYKQMLREADNDRAFYAPQLKQEETYCNGVRIIEVAELPADLMFTLKEEEYKNFMIYHRLNGTFKKEMLVIPA